MDKMINEEVIRILSAYQSSQAEQIADALRSLWLQFEPKSVALIKGELREQQETVGIPVEKLREIGKLIGKAAKKDVDTYLPLVKVLWDQFGREGRVVAVYPLGEMELVEPEKMLPMLIEICRDCLTWEDADQFAMRALEPIIRKDPETWVGAIDDWIIDQNKWVRRAGITVLGRLAMKFPQYTSLALEKAELLLLDEDTDVKKAVSFGIRLAARGDVQAVVAFMIEQVPPKDARATWVLCDVVRSMAAKLLPEFTSLLGDFRCWAASDSLDNKELRSIQSVISKLEKVA